MKNFNKNIKGVTLVSLITTIIVLIILASIGTYSGAEVIKSSKFTKFTTEMKIMQTHVNQLYEQYRNGDKEVLNLGKEINTVQEQADKVFSSDASGITDQTGYRYFDQATIKSMNIEGIEEEFFINIKKRSVVSYKGIKYEGVTYYTLEQIPNGLYNVNYEQNSNKPKFETSVEEIGDNKWRVSISNIEYEGYIDKWEVKYKLEGQEHWNTSDELGFVVNQSGKYLIKIANENVESKEITIICGNSLPDEYQQVEYIESTGTQYIDTGIIGTQDIIIDTTFSWTKYLARWNYFFNAMAQSSDGYWYGIGQASGNRNTRVNMGGTGGLSNITSYTDVPYNDFTKHHYFIKDFSITVDESNTYKIQSNGDFSTVYPIAIFANNKVGTITEYSCARLYTFKMYNKDNMIRDFIPCYKKNTGEIGLYDLVEGKFYTNQGTGTFEKRADVNNSEDNEADNNQNIIILPAEYQQIEYIESTGTQFILTDIKVETGFKLEADVYMSSANTGEYAFAGARFGTSGSAMECYIIGGVPRFWANIDNEGRKIGEGGSAYDKKIHYVAELSPEGMYCETDTNGSFSNSYVLRETIETPLMFFAFNANGTPKYHFRGRVYELKIFNNDNLTNYFIPCYQKDTGEIGLYDTIEGKFYTNQGTGTFEKGADISKLHSEYQQVEYIESTGTQYIDTGIKVNQNSRIDVDGMQINKTNNSIIGSNPYFVITSGSGYYRFRYNNNVIDTKIVSSERSIISLNKNAAYVNNELQGTFEETIFQSPYTAILFGRTTASGGREEINSSRIYYCKIWDNDVLVRDFIPCYKKDTGEIGFYDIVNKEFYTNQGTGTFEKGADVN